MYTYFVEAVGLEPRRIKIGKSTHPVSRLQSMQTGSPVDLRIAHKVLGDRESEFHTRYQEYRLHGEWFSREGELAEYLDECERASEAERQQNPPPLSALRVREPKSSTRHDFTIRAIANELGCRIVDFRKLGEWERSEEFDAVLMRIVDEWGECYCLDEPDHEDEDFCLCKSCRGDVELTHNEDGDCSFYECMGLAFDYAPPLLGIDDDEHLLFLIDDKPRSDLRVRGMLSMASKLYVALDGCGWGVSLALIEKGNLVSVPMFHVVYDPHGAGIHEFTRAIRWSNIEEAQV